MRAVLLVIADAANADGEGSYPGLENMIEFSLYSRSAVLATIKELAADQWIETTGIAKRGQRAIYRVLMTVPECVHQARLRRSELPRHRREEVTIPSVQILDPNESDGVQNAEPLGSRIEANGVQNGESALYTNGLNVLNTNGETHETLAAQAPPRGQLIQDIFDAWCESTSRDPHRTKLDVSRRTRIGKALDAYPLADVLDAVRGWANSPHHRGDNDRHRPFNDIGLILRDATHIEMFRDFARAGRPAATAGPRRHTDHQGPTGRIAV